MIVLGVAVVIFICFVWLGLHFLLAAIEYEMQPTIEAVARIEAILTPSATVNGVIVPTPEAQS